MGQKSTASSQKKVHQGLEDLAHIFGLLTAPSVCDFERKTTNSYCSSEGRNRLDKKVQLAAQKRSTRDQRIWHIFFCCRLKRLLWTGALWAMIAQNVKKPPLIVNVINFEFFGFNVAIWVPWSPLVENLNLAQILS